MFNMPCGAMRMHVSSLNNNNPFIEVKLHHPFADGVTILTTYGEFEMDRRDAYTFYRRLPLTESTNYIFNLKVWVNNGLASRMVINRWGTEAEYITLNGHKLDNDFMINTNISPKVAYSFMYHNGSNISLGDGEKWTIPDERIPPESAIHQKYVLHKLPPDGFSTALPWLHALHNGTELDSSHIEMEYLKLYACNESNEVLIFEDNTAIYDNDFTQQFYDHGDTYLRHPFMYNQTIYKEPITLNIQNGRMMIYTDSQIDRVFHWWGSSRTEIPIEATHLRAEVKVKIIGTASLQLGIDFWRGSDSIFEGVDVNNTECGVSDHYFSLDNDDWQIISLSTEELVPWDED